MKTFYLEINNNNNIFCKNSEINQLNNRELIKPNRINGDFSIKLNTKKKINCEFEEKLDIYSNIINDHFINEEYKESELFNKQYISEDKIDNKSFIDTDGNIENDNHSENSNEDEEEEENINIEEENSKDERINDEKDQYFNNDGSFDKN